MPQVAFDTLEFAKELEKAGFAPEMAAAQAKAQVRILSDLVDRQVATKSDINDIKMEINDVKADVKDVKKDLEIKIDYVKGELKNKIDRLDGKIDQVAVNLESKINYLDSKIDSIEQKLSIKMGKNNGCRRCFYGCIIYGIPFLIIVDITKILEYSKNVFIKTQDKYS